MIPTLPSGHSAGHSAQPSPMIEYIQSTYYTCIMVQIVSHKIHACVGKKKFTSTTTVMHMCIHVALMKAQFKYLTGF